jgi:hypothetical protein
MGNKNWEFIREIPGVKEDPFDVRYGPTPACLSANDIVRIFDLGVLPVDMEHLQTCNACLEKVDNYSRVEPHKNGLKARRPGRFFSRSLEPVAQPALLFVEQQEPFDNLTQPLTMRVVAPRNFYGVIDHNSIELGGDLQATGSTILKDHRFGAEIRFHGISPSKTGKSSLKKHTPISALINLRAKPSEPSALPLLARASIRVKPG